MDETKGKDQALVPQNPTAGKQSVRQHTSGPSQGVGAGTERRDSRVPATTSPSSRAPDNALEARRGEGPAPATGGAVISGPLQQMHSLIERAGEVPFDQRTIAILSAPIADGLVSVKPNGLIYVSHPHYRDRLDRAYGVGAWCLVPLGVPRVEGNRVLWYGFLKAAGQFVADAVGGQDYFPGNRQMNYDDAIEGAKSDCLVRCCKALPMFRECWDKEYGDYWKATYAEQVRANGGRGDLVWRKKGEAMRGFSGRPDRDPESAFDKPPQVEEENAAHMESLRQERLRAAVKGYVLGNDKPNNPLDTQADLDEAESGRLMAEQFDDDRKEE